MLAAFLPNRLFTITLHAAVFILATSSANAGPLVPGGFTSLFGTTSAANPDLAGTVQDDSSRPFEIRDDFDNLIITGRIQDRVSRSDNTGELIFAPRLRDLIGVGGVVITQLRIDGYGLFSTNVEYRTDGSGDVGPGTAVRSFDGDALRFHYDQNPILPPDESHFLSIQTDAIDFAPVGSAVITAQQIGGGTFTVKIEGINVPVPEPASCLLLVGGLAAVATICQRRRSSH